LLILYLVRYIITIVGAAAIRRLVSAIILCPWYRI